MRKIVLITFFFLLVFIDLGSKIFIEESVFGSWKEICAYPDINSAATPEYCKKNTLTLTSLLSIKLSYNDGIAFSLPIRGIPLQIITLLIIVGIIYFYIRDEYPKGYRLLDSGYICILAGAISHAYERIYIGHVVDFIAIKYFAILNFADIFISLGAFLILLSYVYTRRESR